MALDRDHLRWNGWGRQRESFALSDARKAALVATLSNRMGVVLKPLPRAAELDEVVLPPSRLTAEAEEALAHAVSPERVHTSARERAQHAGGKSFADMLRQRDG